MLKLKLQYFGHLLVRTNSLEKTLMLGKIEGGRRRGRQRDEMFGWHWASLVVQSVKNLPAVQETWVRTLGWEDPLEKETSTHSSIIAWKISWTEEPGELQFMGSQRVGHD